VTAAREPAAGRIRVLVVDDSATQRAALVAALEGDPALVVAGWAGNGAEAVRAAALLRPDVITMDLQMPVMDGLEATRRIMRETPTPIVMVTAHLRPDEQSLALEAIEAGVLTVVPTPGPSPRAVAKLVDVVKSMSQVKVIRRWTPERLRAGGQAPLQPAPGGSSTPPRVVGIGASTGGPPALLQILSPLPRAFAPPVLVVQHIAAGFEGGLVDWLGRQCALPVELAVAGRRLDRPGILIAPPGQHLVVRAGAIALVGDAPVGAHRPSATALFQSLAAEYGPRAVGVLLTGMGDDGAAGLRDMKRRGATTIAQDEASSVVHAMPAAAIALGVVDRVLSPPEIAQALLALARVAADR